MLKFCKNCSSYKAVQGRFVVCSIRANAPPKKNLFEHYKVVKVIVFKINLSLQELCCICSIFYLSKLVEKIQIKVFLNICKFSAIPNKYITGCHRYGPRFFLKVDLSYKLLS